MSLKTLQGAGVRGRAPSRGRGFTGPATSSAAAQAAVLAPCLFVFTVRVSAKKLAIQTLLGGRMKI